jgi:nitrite reductase/ring-hydroxylating ferredoxin subunit/uncharacterized membrane protein
MENPETPHTDRPVDRLARWGPLRSLAELWQPVVRNALERAPALGDVLHGTPLGHPLHPLLTDVPVGAFTVVAVFDALELGGRGELSDGADGALALGIVSAGLAASSGWADWSQADGDAKSVGMAHAACNGAALAAYVAALALRRAGRRQSGIGLAFLGYTLLGLAGYLGGELAFGLQEGVRKTAEPVALPDGFRAVLDESELPERRPKRVDFGGLPVVLYREGGEIFALSAVCTHSGGPLDAGTVEDGCLTCPWHGSGFRLTDGAVTRGPATFPVARYSVRIENGKIALSAG